MVWLMVIMTAACVIDGHTWRNISHCITRVKVSVIRIAATLTDVIARHLMLNEDYGKKDVLNDASLTIHKISTGDCVK